MSRNEDPSPVDTEWAKRLFGDPVTQTEFAAIRSFHERVEQRIAAAVKAEREACAVDLDKRADTLKTNSGLWAPHSMQRDFLESQSEAFREAATALRARGASDE